MTLALTAATSSPLPRSRRTESMPPPFGQSTLCPSGLTWHGSPPPRSAPPKRVKRMLVPVSNARDLVDAGVAVVDDRGAVDREGPVRRGEGGSQQRDGRGRAEGGEQPQHDWPRLSPGARHTICRVGGAPRLTTYVYVRPTVSAAVIVSRSRVPTRRRARRKP